MAICIPSFTLQSSPGAILQTIMEVSQKQNKNGQSKKSDPDKPSTNKTRDQFYIEYPITNYTTEQLKISEQYDMDPTTIHLIKTQRKLMNL